MATAHNSAQMGDFAKTVLMPGDPLRAKFVAEKFLDNVRLVTSVRNVYGFTGTYKGVPVSVMASGMGMPSIGIYSYELYTQYGVENIVRIGSAGSYKADLHVNDVLVAESAYSDSTYALSQSGDTDKVQYPTKQLNDSILSKAEELGIPCRALRVHSSDAFYHEPDMESYEVTAERTGTSCVEMEAFALFHNAKVLGKNAACLLTISDSMVSKELLSAEDRQNSFTKMMELALESAITW